jgi:hypothetical protein
MVAACGSDGGGDDDDDADPPNSLNDVCVVEGGAICERAIECFPEDAPTQAACVNDFVAACCGDDGNCGTAVANISRDEWNACLDAYPDFPCSELEDSNLPPECLSFKPQMPMLRRAAPAGWHLSSSTPALP